jgi:DNA polymerase-1
MLAHSLVEPEQRHKMDYLAESLLGYTPISYDSVFGAKIVEKTGQLNLFGEAEMSGATPAPEGGPSFDDIARYASEDADVTWQLAAILRQQVRDSGQERVLLEIECPLVPVLVAMEKEGIRVDPAALAETGELLAARIAEYEKVVYEAAGTPFNLNSPKQVGEILFERLHLDDKAKKTKTGQYKTDEQTLSALATEHKIVRDLLAYREAAKLKSTYVDALPESIFPGTGRIHTTFHQLLTATGRLASNHPNLQNIPIRSEQGREIRRAFVPRDADYLILSADYSQIELRVMASLCADPAMIEAFQSGADIHQATAARVFGVPLDGVTSDMRRTAKMVNFGIIYGISAFGLSQRLNGELSRGGAQEVIDEYFRQYPGVKRFQDETIEQARRDGYVETLTGRRRTLRDINSKNGMIRSAAERTAINTPIQGTAADMIKIAMVRVARLLDEGGYRTRMLLQVHDELVFDLHRGEKDELVPKIGEAMKTALPLAVPVVVESGTGENWLEAH